MPLPLNQPEPQASNEEVFGDNSSNNSQGGNKSQAGGGSGVQGEKSIPNQDQNQQQQAQQKQSSQSPQQTEFKTPQEVVSAVANGQLDPQTGFKTAQSLYDKLHSKVQNLESQNQQSQTYKQFAEAFASDDEYRKAVIAQYHPEVFQPSDPKTYMQDKLKEEFGEDFEYDDAPRELRILYDAKAKEYYDESKQKKDNIPSLDELRATRKQQRENTQKELKQQKQEVMEQTNWNEEQFNNFFKQLNNLKLKDFIPLFKQQQQAFNNEQNASLSYMPGGQPPQSGHNDLDALFGTKKESLPFK